MNNPVAYFYESISRKFIKYVNFKEYIFNIYE